MNREASTGVVVLMFSIALLCGVAIFLFAAEMGAVNPLDWIVQHCGGGACK